MKKVLKVFTDPQRPLQNSVTAEMRQATTADPRNIWERPVYSPRAWTPSRPGAIAASLIPSRGKRD